jgi:multidrug efflux pump subunit AcrB
VLLVALGPDAPVSGEPLQERLRARLAVALPDTSVSFEAGDIVTQVMSFGAATPVEIAVQGANLQVNREHAEKIRKELEALSYLRDVQFAQPLDYPTLNITVDRERAGQFGLTMSNVARSLLMVIVQSLRDPNYWCDPAAAMPFRSRRFQSLVAFAEDVDPCR